MLASIAHILNAAVQAVGWAACVVYSTIPLFWLMIHPRADYWRSRQRSPYRLLLPFWGALWVIVGAVTWPWRQVALYRFPLTWLPAAALFLMGFLLYKRASTSFSPAQLGGVPEVQRGHRNQQLITTGIRARVRHPIYLGHLCEMLAWSVGTGLLVCYSLTAFAVVSGAIMIRMEDAELEQRFGEKYRSYRDSVPAIIPNRSIYNPSKLKADG